MYDYEDEDGRPHDYGFDLPDTRHEFITKDGGHVSISVHRHWYTDEDEDREANFKVSFTIVYTNEFDERCEDGERTVRKNEITELPIGVDEGKAYDIAHLMYEEDVEASDSIREMRAEEWAERRMGA